MGEVAKCRVSSGFCLPEVIHSGLFFGRDYSKNIRGGWRFL